MADGSDVNRSSATIPGAADDRAGDDAAAQDMAEFSVVFTQHEDSVRCIQVEPEPLGNEDQPEQFVLLADGLFAVHVSSGLDQPMLVQLEVAGVKARSYHRLPANGQCTIRTVQLQSGMHPEMLQFARSPNPSNTKEVTTNNAGDLTVHTVDMSQDVAEAGYPSYVDLVADTMPLRVRFFPKKQQLGAWVPATTRPIAVIAFRAGAATRLAGHFGIPLPETQHVADARQHERAAAEQEAARIAYEEKQREQLRLEPWRRKTTRPPGMPRAAASGTSQQQHAKPVLRRGPAGSSGASSAVPRGAPTRHDVSELPQAPRQTVDADERERAASTSPPRHVPRDHHIGSASVEHPDTRALRAERSRTKMLTAERLKLVTELAKWKREAEEWRSKCHIAQQALYRERAAAKRRDQQERERRSPVRRSASPNDAPRARSPYAPTEEQIASARARQLCPLPREARAPARSADGPGPTRPRTPQPTVSRPTRTSSTAPRRNKYRVAPTESDVEALASDRKQWGAHAAAGNDAPAEERGDDAVMLNADDARALLQLADHGRQAIMQQTSGAGAAGGKPEQRSTTITVRDASPVKLDSYPTVDDDGVIDASTSAPPAEQPASSSAAARRTPGRAVNAQLAAEDEAALQSLFPTDDDFARLESARAFAAQAATRPMSPPEAWRQANLAEQPGKAAKKQGRTSDDAEPASRTSLWPSAKEDDDDGAPVLSHSPARQPGARTAKPPPSGMLDYFTLARHPNANSESRHDENDEDDGIVDFPPILSPLKR